MHQEAADDTLWNEENRQRQEGVTDKVASKPSSVVSDDSGILDDLFTGEKFKPTQPLRQWGTPGRKFISAKQIGADWKSEPRHRVTENEWWDFMLGRKGVKTWWEPTIDKERKPAGRVFQTTSCSHEKFVEPDKTPVETNMRLPQRYDDLLPGYNAYTQKPDAELDLMKAELDIPIPTWWMFFTDLGSWLRGKRQLRRLREEPWVVDAELGSHLQKLAFMRTRDAQLAREMMHEASTWIKVNRPSWSASTAFLAAAYAAGASMKLTIPELKLKEFYRTKGYASNRVATALAQGELGTVWYSSRKRKLGEPPTGS